MKFDTWMAGAKDAVGSKRSCTICQRYGPKTTAGKALREYLDLPWTDRHGVALSTFVREFMQGHLGIAHCTQTWQSHIVRCLGKGDRI